MDNSIRNKQRNLIVSNVFLMVFILSLFVTYGLLVSIDPISHVVAGGEIRHFCHITNNDLVLAQSGGELDIKLTAEVI